MCAERASTTIELVGIAPVIVIVAVACVQALVAGCAMLAAQDVAGRIAVGVPEVEAVDSVPKRWRDDVVVTERGSEVVVRISVPSVVPGVASPFEVTGSSSSAEDSA